MKYKILIRTGQLPLGYLTNLRGEVYEFNTKAEAEQFIIDEELRENGVFDKNTGLYSELKVIVVGA